MKITSVECFAGDYLFVRVNTDEGISGWGECGLAYGKCTEGAFGNCQDFARAVLGMDPFDTEKIWDHLHRHTFWGMGGGVTLTAAMAAIDTACWDIKGKALGVPVYKLLGGKTNGTLRCYASQLQNGWRKAAEAGGIVMLYRPEEYYEVTKEAISEGYDAVKVDPVFCPPEPVDFAEIGYSLGHHVRGSYPLKELELAKERIAAVREAAGPYADILIETHSLIDTNTAIQLARALEPFNIMYLEEPTCPENPELFKVIAQHTSIPLATGERSYSRWGFRDFLKDRSLSMIQPDLCNTGGITETKKICDMAEVYDIGVQIHVCGGPLATAAALQVEAVIPNFIIHEEHCANLKASYREYGQHCYCPVNGAYTIPELPGIGEEVPEKTLQKCRKVTIS